MLRYVTSRYILSCHVMLCYATSCYVMLLSCYVVLCHAVMLRFVTLCNVCYVTFVVMSCRVILLRIFIKNSQLQQSCSQKCVIVVACNSFSIHVMSLMILTVLTIVLSQCNVQCKVFNFQFLYRSKIFDAILIYSVYILTVRKCFILEHSECKKPRFVRFVKVRTS